VLAQQLLEQLSVCATAAGSKQQKTVFNIQLNKRSFLRGRIAHC